MQRGLLGEGCHTNSNSDGHQIKTGEQGASLVAQCVKNLPANAGDVAAIPESREIPHAAEQQSAYTTTTAPACHYCARTTTAPARRGHCSHTPHLLRLHTAATEA